MLKFSHRSESNEKSEFIWPFVYLHGKAEDMNMEAFRNGGDAPDLCVANEPIENYWKDETVSIPCEAGGLPAVCVLSMRSGSFPSGRVALVSDLKALQHTCSVNDWR